MPNASISVLHLTNLIKPKHRPKHFFTKGATPSNRRNIGLIRLRSIVNTVALLLRTPGNKRVCGVYTPTRPTHGIFCPRVTHLLKLRPPRFEGDLSDNGNGVVSNDQVYGRLKFRCRCPSPLMVPLRWAVAPTKHHVRYGKTYVGPLLSILVVLSTLRGRNDFTTTSTGLCGAPSTLDCAIRGLRDSLGVRLLSHDNRHTGFAHAKGVLLRGKQRILRAIQRLRGRTVGLRRN